MRLEQSPGVLIAGSLVSLWEMAVFVPPVVLAGLLRWLEFGWALLLCLRSSLCGHGQTCSVWHDLVLPKLVLLLAVLAPIVSASVSVGGLVSAVLGNCLLLPIVRCELVVDAGFECHPLSLVLHAA